MKNCQFRTGVGKTIWAVLALSLALPFSGARAGEGDARFAVSPESAFSLLDQAIAGAQSSIDVNIYSLSNRAITRALANKAASGVKVTVLLEGDANRTTLLAPVKKVLDDFNQDLKARAPRTGRFYVLSGQNGNVQKRFVFDHAKYLVIDGKKVFVSSDNFTGTAFGNRNMNNGTRGWQIELENSALAASLHAMFQRDSDPRAPDVVTYDNAVFKVKNPGGNLPPSHPRDVQSFPVQSGKVDSVTSCTSPDSLGCFLDFVASAKTDLVVEHLSMPLYWVNSATKAKTINPLVQAFLDAARRGVKVRVLLNDDNAFGDEGGGDPDLKNNATVNWLNAQAAANKLPISLEAAIINPKALQVAYVHNKGMVADGRRAFVGSINGTENSIRNNRELALAVDSTDAAAFYGSVFELDWTQRFQ